MRLILTIFICHFSIVIFGQVKIVKDNIACLYGLKHTETTPAGQSGEWIVKPDYTLITSLPYHSKHYLTLKNYKYGLMDSKGKIIVDNIYSEIKENQYYNKYLEIRIGQKKGVIDTTGKIIIQPDKYYSIAMQPQDFFIAYGHNGYYLYKGEKLYSKNPSHNIFTNVLDHKMCFDLIKIKNRKLTSRLVDENFNTVLEAKHAIIKTHCNHVLVSYKDSLQIYDKNFQLVYSLPFPNIYDYDLRFQNTNEKFRYHKQDKWGIADLYGKIIVEPNYDNIQPINYTNQIYKYQVSKNGFIGYLDSNGIAIIPPIYKGLAYHRNNDDDLIYLEKDGKLVVYDQHGNMLLEPKYRYLEYGAYRHVIYDSANIYEVKPVNYTNEKDFFKSRCVVGKNKIELGEFTAYTFDGRWTAFYRSGKDWRALPDVYIYADYEKFTVVNGENRIIYDKKGKPIEVIEPKFKRKKDITPTHSIYRDQRGNYGILRGDSIIVNAQFPLILDAHYKDGNLIWIKKGKDEDCRFGETYAGNWYLCNLEGNPIRDYSFDIPFNLNHDSEVAYTDNKAGIFDCINLQFIIPAKYDQITTDHLAFYPDGTFQLLNYANKFISEKTWKYAINCFTLYSDLKSSYVHDTYWDVYINDEDSLAVSLFGDSTSNTEFIKKLIYEGNYLTQKHPLWSGYTYNVLLCTDEEKEKYGTTLNEVFDKLLVRPEIPIRNPNHTNLVFSSADFSDTEFTPIDNKFVLPENGRAHFFSGKVEFCNDDYVSIQNIHYTNGIRFYNYYRAYGYMFEFGLTDIFKKDVNIEDRMIILLTEAVHDRDDLFLNCHDPKTIFDRTGKTFYFDENGLHFYLKDEKYTEREITIPWKKLKKYAPEKGIVTDFISAAKN